MADYINRELLLKDLETSIVVSGRTDVAPLELRGVHKVIDRIKAMPTEDVVPVVRCSQCKWCDDMGMSGLWCNHPDNRNPLGCLENDFCNYGERKDDND
ncbi:MAG: hypothetical protein IKU66_05335 [Clostridia bacterium]|nr:hypothetical protein [Clostridia bacterium]